MVLQACYIRLPPAVCTCPTIIAETKMCLEYFEPYLLSLGPMIWKKEKRLDELDRMARSIAFRSARSLSHFPCALLQTSKPRV